MRINVGCGQSPTSGWRNFDNSISLRLSKIPYLVTILRKCKVLAQTQLQFAQFCRINNIEYGDPIKKLPLADSSVEVFYSSHMIEHLDRIDAEKFLKEARRVLCSGGIIRLAVPDLKKLVEEYEKSGDADCFLSSALLCQPKPRTIFQKIAMVLSGPRNHQWMYDAQSLCRILKEHGFENVEVQPPGQTTIENPRPLNLREREAESLYLEARNP